MRPTRVRLEGFSAYRGPAELDLSGTDFFSLSGPTGSGKSSLVDAMSLALYGRVPRLGGKSVAPAMTAGAGRARVALDFEVDGTAYTAARLLERTKSGGATVKEARLQRGDEVVADGADGVTEAVEDLLRLRFDDFTRTVVLPQGDFARFLTAPRAERQSLLRSLLGMDAYAEVRGLARARSQVAAERAAQAGSQLEGVDEVTSETVEAAAARAGLLEELSTSVLESEEELARLAAESRDATGRADTLEGLAGSLAALEAPAEIGELDALLSAAHEAHGAAREALEAEASRLGEIDAALAELPPTAALESAGTAHRRRLELRALLEALAADEAAVDAEAARATVHQARGHVEAAESALQAARSAHAAYDLAAHLEAGEVCPVCQAVVEGRPRLDAPPVLAEAESSLGVARASLEEAREAHERARDRLARVETEVAQYESRLAALELELAGAPSPAEIDALTERRSSLEAERQAAAEVHRLAEEAHRGAARRVESLSEKARTMARGLMAARERVAELGPPLPESDDVVVQWKELLSWREETLDGVRGSASESRAKAAALAERLEEVRAGIIGSLGRAGVEAVPPYAVGAARALEAARHEVARLTAARESRLELERALAAAAKERDLASALAGHLRADGFERWMMSGAIAELVAGANTLLGDLSSGGYALLSDEGGAFEVVDHRSAGETRPVSTLSGGETFLVSLALALSLAEMLAGRGGARLEAIILDEGFGTLDEESLDTVATVLEDLAGDGLMVGVITHVRDLAARADTRFEVTRGAGGSTVELVS